MTFLKNIFSLESVLHKRWVDELLLWIVIYILLTLSNTSVDLRLSAVLSASILVGIILLSHLCNSLFIPKLLERYGSLAFISSSVIVLAGSIWLFSSIDTYIVSYYNDLIDAERSTSLLDTQLPSEPKHFFDQNTDMVTSISDDAADEGVFITPLTKISILFILSFFVNLSYYYMQKMKKEEALRGDLEQKRTEMELKFLRSQINPHFLFNALNNIYSMVYMNDKNAPDSILILSEMLRYVTDESKQNRILLRDEIHYIENYINFQRFSYESQLNLTFDKRIESDLVYISPMLLEPFVENSFKYSGVGMVNNAYLHITLTAQGDQLYFETVNSKGIKQKKGKTEREGVGMQNVMKRLELLYPDSHHLNIEDADDFFKVSLSLTTIRPESPVKDFDALVNDYTDKLNK